MMSLEKLRENAATLNRGQLITVLEHNGVFPGSAEYMSYRRLLGPCKIRLGYEQVMDRARSRNPRSVLWLPSFCSNPSLLVLGSSGAGKTEALNLIARIIIEHGIPLLVLDFHGDLIIEGIISVLMSDGRLSTVGVNPLELAVHNPDVAGLFEQRSALVGMLKRAIPSLSANQQHILNMAMKAAYHERGIRDDDPNTWRKEPPTFRWVLDVLNDWKDGKGPSDYRDSSIVGCIQAIEALFEHPVFFRKEFLHGQQILRSCTRVDLSHVDDRVRYIVAETLLRKVFNQLQMMGPVPHKTYFEDECIRLFVLIDEAKILSMGKGSPERADSILNKIATEGRKFGLGLILASQRVDHFGADVRSNMGSRLILKQNDFAEAKKIGVDIQENPRTLLALRGNGDGFFRTGRMPETVRLQVESLSQRSRNTLMD